MKVELSMSPGILGRVKNGCGFQILQTTMGHSGNATTAPASSAVTVAMDLDANKSSTADMKDVSFFGGDVS